jgi:hypothetical protein
LDMSCTCIDTQMLLYWLITMFTNNKELYRKHQPIYDHCIVYYYNIDVLLFFMSFSFFFVCLPQHIVFSV